jgi:CheY-like chemotaxis protein
MIVDNNRKMRGMIRNVLHNSVDTFIECSDGSEVIHSYETHHPDWILMDIVMEHVDGITATKEVTRTFPEAKVIVVTQYDDADLREKAERAGAVAYVVKENLNELERIIFHKN